MHRRVVVWLMLLSTVGCATIPAGVRTRTARIGRLEASPASCHRLDSEHALRSSSLLARARLDPDRIKVLIWNTLKGSRDGWGRDFERYASGQDLLVLQEVAITSDLAESIDHAGMSWDLAIAFEFDHQPTGVMTASRVRPKLACAQYTMEPFLWLPKSSLVSYFPVAGSGQDLAVANVHAVNFTFGTAEFRFQLHQLADVLSLHEGPLIVAGDFNTWSAHRLALLAEILVDRLGLAAVGFGKEFRTAVFGRPLDHAYYRGLRILTRSSEVSVSSDHNPLWVEFAIGEWPDR